MRRNLLKTAIRPIILIAMLGLAVTVLVGCGTGHGPYRHGCNSYHNVESGHDYRNSGSYGAMYGPVDDKGYHRHMPRYGDCRGGYCGW